MRRRTFLRAAAAIPVALLSGCAVYDDGYYVGDVGYAPVPNPHPHPVPPPPPPRPRPAPPPPPRPAPQPPRPAPPPHFAGPGPRPGFRPAPPPPGPHRPADPRMMHRTGGPRPIGPGRPGPGLRNPPDAPAVPEWVPARGLVLVRVPHLASRASAGTERPSWSR